MLSISTAGHATTRFLGEIPAEGLQGQIEYCCVYYTAVRYSVRLPTGQAAPRQMPVVLGRFGRRKPPPPGPFASFSDNAILDLVRHRYAREHPIHRNSADESGNANCACGAGEHVAFLVHVNPLYLSHRLGLTVRLATGFSRCWTPRFDPGRESAGSTACTVLYVVTVVHGAFVQQKD